MYLFIYLFLVPQEKEQWDSPVASLQDGSHAAEPVTF